MGRLFTFILTLSLITSAEVTVLKNEFYSAGWDEEVRSTVWTRHILNISENELSRNGMKYTKDERVNSFESKDYVKSGFDRGHLVPAGDLNFSKKALQSTFLMTNIMPQKPEFNRGSWLNLEEQIRGWNEGKLEVTTGALFGSNIQYANSQVPIPTAFYKVINSPEKGVIGFILPNKANHQPLENYIRSIKDVEELTNISFPSHKIKKSNWFRKPMLFYTNLLIFLAGFFYLTKKRNKLKN